MPTSIISLLFKQIGSNNMYINLYSQRARKSSDTKIVSFIITAVHSFVQAYGEILLKLNICLAEFQFQPELFKWIGERLIWHRRLMILLKKVVWIFLILISFLEEINLQKNSISADNYAYKCYAYKKECHKQGQKWILRREYW